LRILEGANLALRFLLELSALAATAYWGYNTGSGVTRWLLAVGAPALVILVWALFISPNPAIELARPIRLVLEFMVFGAAALALAAAGQWTLAVAFAAVAAISGTLNYIWDQRPLSSPRSVRLGP
jgi:Protein of unknown function (DUF2568)